MNATIAIANHLNVSHQAITRVEEWAKVLFVVVKGLGARFVSKKVVMEGYKDLTAEQFELTKQYFLKTHKALDGGIFGNGKALSIKESRQLKNEISQILNELTKSGVKNPRKYVELDPRSNKYQPSLNPVK